LETPQAEHMPGVRQFWVRFDDEVMLKTHLELLNISLKNTAHKSVALLSCNAQFVSPKEALDRLTRFSAIRADAEFRARIAKKLRTLSAQRGVWQANGPMHGQHANLTNTSENADMNGRDPGNSDCGSGTAQRKRDAPSMGVATAHGEPKRVRLHGKPSPRRKLSRKTNYAGDQNAGPEEQRRFSPPSAAAAARETFHAPEPPASLGVGYWAHVFDVDDIDEVWRAMCNAHIFGQQQLGEVFEICSCYSIGKNGATATTNGETTSEGFDVLANQARHRREPSVALMVPCACDHEVMATAGRAISRSLNLRVPLYYRVRPDKSEGALKCSSPGDCVSCKSREPAEPCAMALDGTTPELVKVPAPRKSRTPRKFVCPIEFGSFFRVHSRSEHTIVSQYKIAVSSPAVPKVVGHAPAGDAVHRQNWGSSFRLRPPQHQHNDPGFQLYRVQGVIWRVVS